MQFFLQYKRRWLILKVETLRIVMTFYVEFKTLVCRRLFFSFSFGVEGIEPSVFHIKNRCLTYFLHLF